MKTLNRFFDNIIDCFSRRDWIILTTLTAVLIILVGMRPGYELRQLGFFLRGTDKVLHALAYGGLTACVFRSVYPLSAWRRPFGGNWAWVLVLGIPLVVGSLDEFLQGFAPGRARDMGDLAADMAGAGFVYGLAVFFRARARRR